MENKLPWNWDCDYCLGEHYIKPCPNCTPKEYAYKMMRENPSKIIVEKQCSCDKKKIQHHEDYSKPYLVELLCYKCHQAAHKTAEPYKNFPKYLKHITLGI